MNRAARGALIGGAVGALVAVAQTVRAEDDPQHVVALQAVRGAAQGALVGSLVGWVLDRTSAARSSGVGYADLARDALGDAVEQAVEAALPVVEQAVEQAADAVRRRAS